MRNRLILLDQTGALTTAVSAAARSEPGVELVGVTTELERAVDLTRAEEPDAVLVGMGGPVGSERAALERLRDAAPDAELMSVVVSEGASKLGAALAASAVSYVARRFARRERLHALVSVYGGGVRIDPSRGRTPAKVDEATSSLRPREREVLRLVAMGLTDREIADRLYLSTRTVQNSLASVRQATGLARRSQLARWATEHELV